MRELLKSSPPVAVHVKAEQHNGVKLAIACGAFSSNSGART